MRITIVGLNLVGTSMALALKAADSEIAIMGHDPVSENIKRARDLKAIDKSHWNLISACEEAEVVLLDLSLAETVKTLKALAQNVKPGILIMDTGAVKRPVMAAAAKHLPEGVAFVGGHLVSPKLLASTTEPSADLPKDATMFLVAPEKVSAETVNLATTVAEAVGAVPRFIDAEEHDGLMAATLGLPMAGAVATLRAMGEPAGLQERYKSMGAELYSLGSLLGTTPEETADLTSANADLLVPWIDIYIDRLNEVREALADGNRDALVAIATEVHETMVKFLRRGEEPHQPIADPGTGVRNLLLGGFGRKKPS